MHEGGAGFRLTTRAAHEILFRRGESTVSAAAFLAAAQGVAATLPPSGHLINLCRDRMHFAVAFAAALLRGHVSLLSADLSEARLRALGEQFPDAYSLSDDPAVASPLPHLRFAPDAAGRPENPVIPAEQLAAIVFTSGSTDLPVGHRKSWGALARRSRAAAASFGLARAPASEILGTVPPQHMYGLETTVLLPLHVGTVSWCGPGFYPRDVQQALAAMAPPRVLVTTPLQISTLLRAGLELPTLARVISATSPLPAELAAEAEARWATEVHEIYGATEIGSIASRRTVAGPDWMLYPGVSLAPSGDEVVVRAKLAVPHALNDAIERLDARRFRLLGRKSDLIKLAGKRASLAALNRILNEVEGVVDGVFVAPDDLDHRPTARLLAYAVAPGRSGEDILAALRRRIEPAFLPRRVVLVPALPRNEMGKLPRRALLALTAAP